MKKHITLLLTVLLVWACNAEDPDCGCESEPVHTIEENKAVEGFLFMLTDSQVDYLDDGPLLCIDTDGSGDCNYYYEICNPEALAAIDEIPDYPGVAVSFSGVVRAKCEQPVVTPVQSSWNRITLSSVEKTQ